MRLNDSASPKWIVRAAVIGVGIVVAMWLVGQMLGAAFAPLRLIGQSVTCQSNVFKMTRAFRLYEDDYDDYIPTASNWMDKTFFYIDQERYLHCPTVAMPGSRSFGYSMNSSISGKDRASIDRPDETAIVYDSINLSRSASDHISTLPKPGRHRTRPRKGSPSKPGNFIGYAGGNASIQVDNPHGELR